MSSRMSMEQLSDYLADQIQNIKRLEREVEEIQIQ